MRSDIRGIRDVANVRQRNSSAVTTRRVSRNTALKMAGLAALPAFLFIVVPLVALLVYSSPGDVLYNLTRGDVAKAVVLSLITSLVCTVITLVLGTPLAYVLARSDSAVRSVMDTLVDLPLVLPPAAAGIALLLAFGRTGLLGKYLDVAGIQLPFTPAAVVMAQLFVASPFFVKSAASGIASVSLEVEQAAEVDGAGPWRVARSITLPLARNAMIGGAVMTWARALGEFGATIIFAGNFPGRTQTIPIAIYLGFNLSLQTAVSLSVILLVLSFAVLIFVKRVLKQHVTRADIY